MRGRETFDANYAAFKQLLIGSWRRDELAEAKWRQNDAGAGERIG